MDHILIVDDTPVNIKILNDLLRDRYRISFATDGETALEIVDRELPDLILLDIMMPDVDGYEVCERLKSSEKTAHIPVIFVTAKTQVEDEQKGLELGAVDYITKPISPPITVARIRNHLELKQARDHLEEQVALRTLELAKKVRELESRDRLVQLQMQSPDIITAGQEITKEVAGVIEAESLCLLFPENQSDTLQYEDIYTISNGRMGDCQTELKTEAAMELATKAYQEKKLHLGDHDLLASPMLYQEDVFGVILVNIKIDGDKNRSEIADTLWRMSNEAALVLRMAYFSDDIDNERVDFDALFEIGEKNL